jgi:hypothetical protein
MTKFDPRKFDMGYGSERYVKYDGEFIARFKYGRPTACARHFVKFLVANFTVEEYFEALTKPLIIDGKVIGRSMAPMEVLETKGYIDFNTTQAMKRSGFIFKRDHLDSLMAAHDARMAAKAA